MPQSLEAAIDTAVHLEATMTGSLATQAGAPQRDGAAPMELGTARGSARVRGARGGARGGGRGNDDSWKRQATCHFCGKKGHIKPNCCTHLN